MKTRWITIAAAMLGTAGLEAAPLDDTHVAADARWVAHLDCEVLARTQVGRHLLEQWMANDAQEDARASLAALGIDVRRDLRAVTAYGTETEQEGVLLLTIRAPHAQLVARLRDAAGYRALPYGRHTVHTWQGEGETGRQYGALHGAEHIVLSSSLARTKLALNVLDRDLPGMDQARALRELLPRGRRPALLAASLHMQGLDGRGAVGRELRNARSAFIGADEQDGEVTVKVQIDAPDAVLAMQYADVVRGLQAVALLTGEGKPELADLAERLQVRTEGDALRLALVAPAASWIAYFEREQRLAAARAAADARPPGTIDEDDLMLP